MLWVVCGRLARRTWGLFCAQKKSFSDAVGKAMGGDVKKVKIFIANF
jgi:hypothetical protein